MPSQVPATHIPIANQQSEIINSSDIPQRLGGHEVIKELGRGGMGAVYLARQLSLDRPVAIKVMNPQWSSNPVFLSRFTREAYAAAQLVHHNVVQIYDIDSDQGTSYFSMEFVPGTSLGGLVKEKGKLDVEEAVGYVIQAARGLKFAHDRGMIHRDIKPDNLMLNSDGIVKVADMGLVKTPQSDEQERAVEEKGKTSAMAPTDRAKQLSGVNVTNVNQAMGTPAYMAPEQAANAAGVDARADIYSLGCTLYVLITGRPVFQGDTVAEVLTKHASEPVVRPEVIVKRVPKLLGDIIMKMVAKKPEDRFQSMDEVIEVLEGFLGVDSRGPFTPREEHAVALEESVARFNASKPAAVRRTVLATFASGCLMLGIIAAAFNRYMVAGGFVGLMVTTFLSYFLLTGVIYKTYLFRRARQFVWGASWRDWAMGVVYVLIIGALLWFFSQLLVWSLVLLVGAGIATAFYFLLDRPVVADRMTPVENAQGLIKKMRLLGLEEDAVRQFACKYGGERWEGLYEALFGYESKMIARQKWGKNDQGLARKKYGGWRDSIVEWFDARQKLRQERREKKHLEKLERAALKSKGVSDADAARQAEDAADNLLAHAADMKAAQTMAAPGAGAAAGGVAAVMAGRSLHMQLTDEAETHRRTKRDRQRTAHGLRPSGIFNLLLGSRARFLLGCLLLVACGMWLNQNGLLSSQDGSLKVGSTVEAAAAAKQIGDRISAGGQRELQLPIPMPAAVLTALSSVSAGLAGLILLLTCFFRGVKMGLFMIPAAAVVLLGQKLGIPPVWKIPAQYMSMAVGGVLVVLGVLFGRRR